MNFLAHLHLSDGTAGSMMGGIAADFVRGPDVAALPADIRAGIDLHRKIDAFTDRHSIVQTSIRRIADRFHWFSGIIIDIYYDHILAREWERYSTESLESFSFKAYSVLSLYLERVGGQAHEFVSRFIADDRLQRYATDAGITETLARVSRRIAARMPGRALPLEEAMPLLRANHNALVLDFHDFYPALIDYANQVKSPRSFSS